VLAGCQQRGEWLHRRSNAALIEQTIHKKQND
jgi:hypothetical protein